MIKAPYNFVPLSEKVFFPDEDKGWSIQKHGISHDIPFKDSFSGKITITIKARSPIFIRDSNNKEEFCNYNNQYYIPGSSLKGVIRSVLEIISFSRINTQDKKYSYRDIDEFEYKEKIVNRQKYIQAGWLYKENDEWKIIPLGNAKQFKMHYNELIDKFGMEVDFREQTDNRGREILLPEKKYKLFDNDVKKLTKNNGVAVFVGKVNPHKDKEYFFPLPNKTNNDIVLSERQIQTFKDAYYIGQPDESKVWKEMWSKEFKIGRFVPVFYLEIDNEISFGLSMLYKIPYAKSVHEGIGNHFVPKDSAEEQKLDLAESLFGFSINNISLKGRVQFSHLKAQGNPKPNNQPITKILSSPKPKYYPAYIKPSNNEQNKMHDKFEISGWKRYPVHKNADSTSVQKTQTTTSFKPLPVNTIFVGTMTYHNLREFELGALLSALTLHGNIETFSHAMGMAKPFGFGKIGIELDMNGEEYLNALVSFEQKMNGWSTKSINKQWIESEQIKELFAMSSPANDHNLIYMGFDGYGDEKKNGSVMKRYSQLTSFAHSISSFLDDKTIEDYKQKAQMEKARKDEERRIKEENEALLQSVPSNKELNHTLQLFVESITNIKSVAYFDHSHFSNYMIGKFDNVPEDILMEYENVYDSGVFKEMEELIVAKYNGTIEDHNKARLYIALKGYLANI